MAGRASGGGLCVRPVHTMAALTAPLHAVMGSFGLCLVAAGAVGYREVTGVRLVAAAAVAMTFRCAGEHRRMTALAGSLHLACVRLMAALARTVTRARDRALLGVAAAAGARLGRRVVW